jgi:penicillin amidase
MSKLRITLIVLLLVIFCAYFYLPTIDRYQIDGSMTLPALSAPVTVKRDAMGIPYIYAESLDDAITAQGFVMGQHRLFQLELLRAMSQGRLAELIGENGLQNDRFIRLLNIPAVADQQMALLSEEEENFFQRYINGLNVYISNYPDEHPLVLKLMSRTPEPWSIKDMKTLQYFQIWSSSANWKQELMNQQLIDHLGPEKARELRAININPDDPATEVSLSTIIGKVLGLELHSELFPDFPRIAMGSNAWASGSRKSAGGAPILSNDPHLDARHLPGFWHPMGLITPDFRAVGGAFPGSPGFGLGRTSHIAFGATNGYSDSIDLYIEEVDPANPDHYIEGDQSLPFSIRDEEILIKDKEVDDGFRRETLRVRVTKRGPVISDHGMSLSSERDARSANDSGDPDEDSGMERVLSLRWSVPEMLLDETGVRRLLLATSVAEAIDAIGTIPTPLNYIVVDYQGNIARQASGYVPLRVRGDGSQPIGLMVEDNWNGRIPAEEMPLDLNPERDWVGSANHRVTESDYPYAYTTYASPSWRYRRLMELFEAKSVTANDHWQFIQDNKNLMAERLTPIIISAINGDPELAEFTDILSRWNFMDTREQAAPAIFQTLYRNFARRVFQDELGEELSMEYLKGYYFWHENLAAKIEANDSDWFDDKSTGQVESRDDIFRLAAHDTVKELSEQLGNNPYDWQWGDIHTLTFFHPLVPGKVGAELLGGGVNRVDGSGETLNRSLSTFDDPKNAKIIDSTRVVMDLSDPDKILAHIPGGVSERLFDKHMKDSLALYLSGDQGYWWFSDKAITTATRHTLQLSPH